jgi:pimeloyl-ACP methyl ester carboxylesterase
VVPSEEFLELAGGRVHLLRGGTGEPVLFLHAAGGAGAWHLFHALLADAGFEVLAPDHPGFGKSDDFLEAEAIDDLVYMSPGSLRGVLASGMRSLGGSSYENLLANGQTVVGSPAAVADRLAELYEKLGGFGQLIGLFAIGPSTHQQVMRSAELFASDVMPALRPLGVAAERTTT